MLPTRTGLPNITNPPREACAPEPPELKVTPIATLVPFGVGPKTTTNLLEETMEHEKVSAPLTVAEHCPPCAGVMKFEPSTVMEDD